MSDDKRTISRGGRGHTAGYSQTTVRCPDPASKITRELLNLYRDKFQYESPDAANKFLQDVLDFAEKHHAGNTETSESNHTAMDDVITNIQDGKPGYKRNSASKLIADILAISETHTA
jgi:hypothetical protein